MGPMSRLEDRLGPNVGDTLGVAIPASVLLLRTDSIGVVFDAVIAYPTHFRFRITHVARIHNGLASKDFQPYQRLEMRMRCFDGTELSWGGPFEEAGTAVLMRQGGHGSETVWEENWIATAIPPAGPVVVDCVWRPTDELGRAEFDGTAIRDAAERATPIWTA
jgi:hypothetical protein